MAEPRKYTYGGELMLPVQVGPKQYVMTKASIKIDGDDTTILIKSRGREGLELTELLMGGEPVSLSIALLPVEQHRPPH